MHGHEWFTDVYRYTEGLMDTSGLPDIYTQGLRVYIYQQATSAHGITNMLGQTSP